MPFGLPLRTRNTIVDVYGELLFGKRDCHDAGSRRLTDWMLSMSHGGGGVTMSALRPSMTARAWLPEPPCDICTSISSPVSASHFATNCSLNSRYSSRVGSYDTFNSCSRCAPWSPEPQADNS